MPMQSLIVIITALLSSIFTVVLAWYVYKRYLARSVEAQLDARLEELGELIESRVRKGVLDAVASIPSTEVLRGATDTVAKTGATLIQEGLNTLLGGRKKR